MNKKTALGIVIGVIVLIGLGLFFNKSTPLASAIVSDRDTYSYVNSISTTTLEASPGVLHTVTIDTVAAGSVLTLWDAKSSTSIQTTATGTITFGPTSSSVSTATGTLVAIIDGQLVTSASLPNGSSSINAATVLTTAINASSSVLGVTATSTNNIVTVTASPANQYGNYPFVLNNFYALPQNGFTVNYAVTLATPIIAQITLPATTTYYDAPITATFDTAYNYGLTVTQATATSTFTVSWQ